MYLVITLGLALGCQGPTDARVSTAVYPARPVAVSPTPTPVAITASGEVVEPWYASRNDRVASVDAGVRTPVFTRSVTRTYDRFSIFDGRARDDFVQRRFTERVVESAQ